MTASLEAQKRLQAEANAVVHRLQLEELLGTLGVPVRVGSSAMALMVRRDIDITVICQKLDAGTLERFSDIAATLVRHSADVQSVKFRNETGVWNQEPAKYPDGLYLGLTVKNMHEAVWTIDIWVVDDPARQPDLRHLEVLLPRLTDENRETILKIKTVLADRPKSPPSALVYEAVVDRDVQTVEQFDAWCRAAAAAAAG
jgi:hypothetical protein